MDPGAPGLRLTVRDAYALAFGMFLGLALLKFGNPVILNGIVLPPRSLTEAWSDPWPPIWAVWLLLPFAALGAWITIAQRLRWSMSRWLWVLPLVWLGWQLISATATVDRQLTEVALLQFAGCVAAYFLGILIIGYEGGMRLMMIGLLGALAICLVRAVDQRLFEFPQERKMLVEGERAGWTNFPPDVLREMEQEHIIISTNGMNVANPVILAKLEKNRAYGTLVYPNALAGAVLLLFPCALVVAVIGTRRFRTATRLMTVGLALFLGVGGLFWTGSKSGWLIAVAIGVLWLLRLKWPFRGKVALIALLAIGSMTVFAVHFRNYFASGATSVEARFDYWRAAAQITREHPVLGSGPGTFQRPYARLKSPDAEMARLTHNDYIEQFCDSGIIGGAAYLAWVGILFMALWKRLWRDQDQMKFALFVGLLGWFAQGLSEFSLYIPALAWTAFALAGCLLGQAGNPFDKSQPPR